MRKYTAVSGALRTVDSYRFVPGISEEQFREALEKGFVLQRYKVRMLTAKTPEKIVKDKKGNIDWNKCIVTGLLLRNRDLHTYKVQCDDVP